MITRDIFAPGRSFRGCLGAFFIVIAVAALGCGRVESPESRALLELAGDTIELGRGAALADILVRSAATTTAVFEPDTITIRQGDVVRFIAADRHPHAISFDPARLAPATEAFLRRTDQLRSPPLIAEGASWIVSFQDAPPGVYPFVDLSQDRHGAIVVIIDKPDQ